MQRPTFALTRAQLWLFLAIALPILGSLLATMSTVDLAYHIRAGSLMLDSGSILRTDPFTFTVGGQPWLDQQWLAQVAFGAVYRAVGWAGLAIVRAVLVALVFGFVVLALRALRLDARRASWLTLAAFVVATPALALRPQLIGMVFFAATAWLLVTRRPHPRRTWLVVPIVLLWANVHGSFVFGPAMAGVAWLEDAFVRRESSTAARSLALLIVSAAATVVNPFGPAVWAYALALSANPEVRQLVTEWQVTSPATVPGALFYASLGAVVALLGWRMSSPRWLAVRWPWLLWLVLLAVLAISAERGVAWWALGAPIAIAPLVRAAEQPRKGTERQETGLRLNALLAAVLVIAIEELLPIWRPTDPITGPLVLLTDAPRDATTALRSVVSPGEKVFTSQRWASWFELSVPDARMFVDSRVELFPANVWADYTTAAAGSSGYGDVLDRYGVGAVAVSTADGLAAAIRSAPGWRLVGQGPDYVVAVRETGG